MQLIDFLNLIISTSLGIVVICLWFRRTCNQEVENISGNLGRDWYLIQSHIWTNDVKNCIRDFVTFMEQILSSSESDDKYGEVFSNAEVMETIKEQLNGVTKAYYSYNDFTDVVPNLTIENRKLKGCYERTILILIGFVLWGIVGTLFINNINTLQLFSNIFWSSFGILDLLAFYFLLRIIVHHKKYEALDQHTRTVKSRYSSVIERVV